MDRIMVESVSQDGVFYLANMSKQKHLKNCDKYLWGNNNEDYICTFKSVASAKATLTKLIKAMPEYKEDKIRFIDYITLKEVEK